MIERYAAYVMRLNGWRRLGAVLLTCWTLTSVGLALSEYIGKHDGYFVQRTLPIGTTVSGNQATLPDGRVVTLRQTLGGKDIKPWEIKWDNEPEIPTEPLVRWQHVLGLGIALPVVVWLLLELLCAVARWVARGFRNGAA